MKMRLNTMDLVLSLRSFLLSAAIVKKRNKTEILSEDLRSQLMIQNNKEKNSLNLKYLIFFFFFYKNLKKKNHLQSF